MNAKIITSMLFASLAGGLQAATIVWSLPAATTNESVIISPTAVVQAYNLGDALLPPTVP